MHRQAPSCLTSCGIKARSRRDTLLALHFFRTSGHTAAGVEDADTLVECWAEVKGELPGVARKRIGDEVEAATIVKIEHMDFNPVRHTSPPPQDCAGRPATLVSQTRCSPRTCG